MLRPSQLSGCLAGFLLLGSALGQTAVPPPPRPPGAGPSLAATLQFIQEKLSTLGKVEYAAYVHDNAAGNDWVVQHHTEYSRIRADESTCRIDFHFKQSTGSGTATEGDFWVPLRTAEDVVILHIEQAWKEYDSKAGHPTWSAKSDPPLYVLRVRRQHGNGVNEFDFTDGELADRVAKAMVHAIELCGGGKVD